MNDTPVQPDLMGGTCKQARDLRPGDTITLGPDQPAPFNAPHTVHLTVTSVTRDGDTVNIEATRATPRPEGATPPTFAYAAGELEHVRITTP